MADGFFIAFQWIHLLNHTLRRCLKRCNSWVERHELGGNRVEVIDRAATLSNQGAQCIR